MSMVKKIAGAGGGGGGGKGGGGGSPRAAVEAADSLRSKEIVSIVDVIAEGPIVGLVNGLQSIYLDETAIQNNGGLSNFADVVADWRNGTQDQLPLNLGSTEADGVSLTEGVSVLVKYDTPIVRTLSMPGANAVRVTVGVHGLTKQDMTNGDINGTMVRLAVEVWDTSSGLGYANRINDEISGKTTSEYRRSYLIGLTGDGPWNIRVSRITNDSTSSSINDKLYFESYTGIIQSRLSYPNTAVVGLRVDSANFNSIPSRAYDIKGMIVRVPSNYNPDTRIYSGLWDGTFKLAWTDNPAWCFYDLITNDRYGVGDLVEPYSIDKWALYSIGQYCDQIVPNGYGGSEPRFTCNLCLNTREDAYKVIQNFASMFRAITFWGAGSVVTVQDRPADPIALFTNANVVNGEFRYAGSSIKQRHTVCLVTWSDPSDFYRQKVEYVQDDEGVRELGVLQTEMVAFGCASRGQAHRAGKWLLATEKYATETVTFKGGLEVCSVYPGAIIETSDRWRAGKRMGGRIMATSTQSTLVLDAPVTIEAGQIYTVSVMNAGNVLHSSRIMNGAGETSELNLLTPLTEPLVPGAAFVLSASNLKTETWRVMGMREEEDHTISVSAVAHYSDLFSYVDADAAFALPIISSIKARPDTPINIVCTASPYIALGRVAGLKLILSWSSDAPRFRVTWTSSEGVTQSREVFEPTIEIDNAIETVYKFQIVAVSSIGLESTPAIYTYDVASPAVAPSSLVDFTATGDMFQNIINWVYPDQIDIEATEIWAATDGFQSSSTKIADLAYPSNSWVHMGLSMGVSVTYWARIKSVSGLYSEWSGPVTAITISDPDLINSVLAGQVTSSALFKAMQSRIATIEGAATDLGTVAEQLALMKVISDTNVAAIDFGDRAIVTNTGAVVESINTLQTQVNDHQASIQTQSQATDALKASYSVMIDNNGYISGFGQSSEMVNGGFQSDFVVLADRFAVVMPGSEKKVPFAIGKINGVTTVGINGATIVDGSISTKSLKVEDMVIQAREFGARMVFTPDVIKVYDDAGNVRVRLGNLLL